jgi:hypothetical protein
VGVSSPKSYFKSPVATSPAVKNAGTHSSSSFFRNYPKAKSSQATNHRHCEHCQLETTVLHKNTSLFRCFQTVATLALFFPLQKKKKKILVDDAASIPLVFKPEMLALLFATCVTVPSWHFRPRNPHMPGRRMPFCRPISMLLCHAPDTDQHLLPACFLSLYLMLHAHTKYEPLDQGYCSFILSAAASVTQHTFSSKNFGN